MAIEIGVLGTGRITRITSWGAFASLTIDGEDISGMIHISELSPAYVREVSDCVAVGDEVPVKVLRIDERGRVALSRKQAMTEEDRRLEREKFRAERAGTETTARQKTGVPLEYVPYVKKERRNAGETSADNEFEAMMRRFQVSSEEKLGSLRRASDGHRTRKKR